MNRMPQVAVVVAHPDDEVLWAGGTLLKHPAWRVFVAALCRGDDADRAPRFRRALRELGAEGDIASLDDGPEQEPLPPALVRATVRALLPEEAYDLVITHGPRGEYTRHRRHEETHCAVAALWRVGSLRAEGMRLFAYEDAGGQRLPRARSDAHRTDPLEEDLWQRKLHIITEIYGFSADAWETRAAPRVEAFWCFHSPEGLDQWLRRQEEDSHEGPVAL